MAPGSQMEPRTGWAGQMPWLISDSHHPQLSAVDIGLCVSSLSRNAYPKPQQELWGGRRRGSSLVQGLKATNNSSLASYAPDFSTTVRPVTVPICPSSGHLQVTAVPGWA